MSSRRRRRTLLTACLLAAGVGVGAGLAQEALLRGVDGLLPDARNIGNFNRPGTVTILSADGEVLEKLGPATREKLASGQMPQLVKRAFIAAEDRRFYQHHGVDPVGIARAMVRNVRQGTVEEGASTITQQLARTVFLSQDRTIIRKLKEAALAGKLERQLSKEQILEQYLNLVYLGSSAYGISDAAWVYFSKTPEQLTLPEAAMIAGLPPAPSVYTPLLNPDLALQRRATVLRRMREARFIDDRQLAEANAAPLRLKPAEPKYWQSQAPWFTSWVSQELPRVLSKEQIELGGLTIRTSLNLDWQKRAQDTINNQTGGALEGALVAMEPGTGLVRAMVGGRSYETSQFNRATQALRSPGSTFKLFTYVAALRKGLKPEDSFSNRQRCYGGFCIKGAGGTSTMANAVARSLNAVAVAVAEKVGYPEVIKTAKELGIPGELGQYPSMVLGANEQTVLDMTAAYAAITNRGFYVSPTPFEEIQGANGELLWSRRVDGRQGRRAVHSDVADAMTWMLEGVVRGGTGSGAGLPGRPVAGKTGTSEGGRDLWFIGSIPQLTTGVWMGYDSNAKTGSSSAAAAWAWQRFMAGVSRNLPVQSFPPKPELKGSFRGGPARPAAPERDTPANRRRWEPAEEALPPRTEAAPATPAPAPEAAPPATDTGTPSAAPDAAAPSAPAAPPPAAAPEAAAPAAPPPPPAPAPVEAPPP
ncbi:MAG: PBP1A family penicillin-binding protein [Prochlorococcaceae cyanobacterium]